MAEASFAEQQLNFRRCQSATELGFVPAGGCTTPKMPAVQQQEQQGPGQPAAPVVTITPAQAAAIAVARLRLPTVAPGIGPSPEVNRWKMAAVGYPLWLWADGPTHRGPVADSAGGVNVSLDARVSSLTFRMGDGTKMDCPGHGTKWTPSVTPGTKSPTCGHIFTKPSTPAGPYRITAVANWTVAWTAGGQSGVIDVPATSTRQLPVGELQSIITG